MVEKIADCAWPIPQVNFESTPMQETNMTMENQPFEDVSPMKKKVIFRCHLSFQGSNVLLWKTAPKKTQREFLQKDLSCRILSLGLRTLDGITSLGSKSSRPKNYILPSFEACHFRSFFSTFHGGQMLQLLHKRLVQQQKTPIIWVCQTTRIITCLDSGIPTLNLHLPAFFLRAVSHTQQKHHKKTATTWRITPLSKWLATPIYMP